VANEQGGNTMIVTDIYGKRINRQLTSEEYKELWVPISEGQPADDPERETYRDAVDELMKKTPLEAISPVRMADYARYQTLYEKMQTELTVKGYNVDRDLDNELYHLCSDIADNLFSLAKAEGRLYMEKARAMEAKS